MLPFVVSISCLLIAFGFCVWLLIKDRKYWRDQYQARDQEAKAREQHLFDQLLRTTRINIAACAIMAEN